MTFLEDIHGTLRPERSELKTEDLLVKFEEIHEEVVLWSDWLVTRANSPKTGRTIHASAPHKQCLCNRHQEAVVKQQKV